MPPWPHTPYDQHMQGPIVNRQRTPRSMLLVIGVVLVGVVLFAIDVHIPAFAPLVSVATALGVGMALDARAARRSPARRLE